MNKVIKGKRYDTETAESIGEFEVSVGRQEELYRKRTGEFFLTHWSQWEKEESTIEPIGLEEAEEWVEEYCNGDTYEELFGKVEDGDKGQLNLSLTESEITKLKAYAVEHKASVSEVVSKFIKSL